jgi:hypothetical protein
MSRWRWGIGPALLALMFLAAGALPVTSTYGYGTDARQFAGEFQSRGAFKFAEDTEDELRAGRFELAYARYLFLRSHIRGSSLYFALNSMVDQRLHFLASQMGLKEIPSYAAPSYKKLKRRVRKQARAVPPKTSAKPAIAPASAEAKEPKPPVPQPGAAEKPEKSAKAPAPAIQTPTQPPEPEPPKEKTEAKKPAPPPPSLWEKLKHRLKFW